MTKRQAKRLSKQITADLNAGATVQGLHAYGLGRWEIVLQDHASGYMTTVGSPQDWKDRQEAKEFAAKHGA